MREEYLEHNRPLLHYCAKLYGSIPANPDVQDLAADTWVKASKAWDSFEGRNDASRRTWLCRIAYNLFLDRKTSAQKRYMSVSSPAVDYLGCENGYLDLNLTLQEVLEEIPKKLTPKQLRVWHLSRLGFEEAEMAKIIGTTPVNIRTRLYRLRKLLRQEFTGDIY